MNGVLAVGAFIAGAVVVIALLPQDMRLALVSRFYDTDTGPAVVVVDSWWSGNYAKNGCDFTKNWMEDNKKLINQIGCESVTSCPDLMPRYSACMLAPNNDPRQIAWGFDNELLTQFAINPSCKGTTFARYGGPSEKASPETLANIQKPHWTLIVDYTVGATAQSWTLVPAKGAPRQAEGARAANIAADVCAIVMGHGGTLAR